VFGLKSVSFLLCLQKLLLSSIWEKVKHHTVQLHNPLRKDRESLTLTWTKPYGIKLPTFDAIMRPNGAEGCFLSHVKIAQTVEAPYVVLEDDAVPTEAANTATELVTNLRAVMEAGAYDIIYLGGMPLSSKPTKVSGIYEGACLTTYAMIVGPRAASVLRGLVYTGTPIDVVLSQLPLRFAFVNPPLFRQAITRSEIGKTLFTRGEFFAHLLGFATPCWRFLVIHRDHLLWFLVLGLLAFWTFRSV